MDIVVYSGAALTVAGLAGLGYCIRKAVSLRRDATDGADVSKALQTLAGLNMAALGFATAGLTMVVAGMLL